MQFVAWVGGALMILVVFTFVVPHSLAPASARCRSGRALSQHCLHAFIGGVECTARLRERVAREVDAIASSTCSPLVISDQCVARIRKKSILSSKGQGLY